MAAEDNREIRGVRRLEPSGAPPGLIGLGGAGPIGLYHIVPGMVSRQIHSRCDGRPARGLWGARPEGRQDLEMEVFQGGGAEDDEHAHEGGGTVLFP